MYLSLGAPNILLILTVKLIKTESTRKLNNVNFQWTKTLYQNILSHIAFFLHFSGVVDIIIIVLVTQFPDGFHLNNNSLSL